MPERENSAHLGRSPAHEPKDLEVVEGMQFDRGYLSAYFVTNAEKMICELDKKQWA